jgi:tripartite-type tricarboxylate transporter receptor subunit TctC
MVLPTPRTLPAGLVAIVAAAALWGNLACAAEYFAGKSIDLLIGAPPGGGYDIYARALARHYGHHIPGQPVIVSKNMPGAGTPAPRASSAESHRRTAPRSPPSCQER